MNLTPGLQFFGNLVDLDCHLQDLKLVLQKTEEIEFPHHEAALEGESLMLDIFPDITRKGFIVTLIIILDDQFKMYCDILRSATDQRLRWNDLKGTALERFIAYSEKVCGISSVCENNTKQLLSGLIEVRNSIVHNNSSIEGFGKRKVVENFAYKLEGLSIEEGCVAFELAGCNRCADIVLQFMEYAYYAALKKFPKN